MITTGSLRGAPGRLALVVVAVAMLAAGCSDGGTETTTEPASSPLADFLGQGDFFSDPEAAQARFAEEERERQEIVASCMQEQGFEYTPVDYSQFDTLVEDIDDFGSPEWTAEWGFGITTQSFSQQQVGPDLKGWDDTVIEEEASTFEDPNQDYIDSLAPQEQQAYFEALHGGENAFPAIDESMSEEEQEAVFEDMAFEPRGCEGEAFGEDPGFSFYQDFEDELEDMEKRFEADPRVTERRAEIVECVTDRGHEYTDMDSVYERFQAEIEGMDPFTDGFEFDFGVTEEEAAEMSEAELEELYRTPPPMPPLADEDKARLGELQTEEIELAVAVIDCGGGFENEFNSLSDIRAEYEEEFLDTYADRLEDYKAG